MVLFRILQNQPVPIAIFPCVLFARLVFYHRTVSISELNISRDTVRFVLENDVLSYYKTEVRESTV